MTFKRALLAAAAACTLLLSSGTSAAQARIPLIDTRWSDVNCLVFSSGWGLGSNLPHVRAVNHTRRRDIQRIYTRLALTRWDGSRWDLIGLSDVFKAVAGDDAYVTHWRSVVDGRVQETAGRILWNINQTGFYKVFTRVRWYGNGRSWKTKPYWRSLSHASHDGSNFCTIN